MQTLSQAILSVLLLCVQPVPRSHQLMPRPLTAFDWKQFYRAERLALGPEGLARLFESDLQFDPPPSGALIFPHTRLSASGDLIAATADAVIRSGVDRVLALGVLHGGRREDAALVARARGGDAEAIRALRGIHGPKSNDHQMRKEEGLWSEEFSLDNFEAMLSIAAERAGRKPPVIIKRYPFLTGSAASEMPGIEELHKLRASGVALVATADLVHHGAAYGTPESAQHEMTDPVTLQLARRWINEGLNRLCAGDIEGFLKNAREVSSDFRDSGPVLQEISPISEHQVEAVRLVDYSDVLESPLSWVSAAVVSCAARGMA
jgi:hypothetical protein